MNFKSPSNHFDALVLALQLAITAPDDDKAAAIAEPIPPLDPVTIIILSFTENSSVT